MVNVNKNSSADVMKSVEDVTDRAVNAQAEKNLFLGEYKERVIKALTFEEIKEKGIYTIKKEGNKLDIAFLNPEDPSAGREHCQ